MGYEQLRRSDRAPDAADDIPPDAFLAAFPWWVVATRLQVVGDEGTVRLGPDSGFLVLDAADGSTLQIVEAACDHIQEGSGFVAAPGLVVTNAHVVAGGDDPRVRSDLWFPGDRALFWAGLSQFHESVKRGVPAAQPQAA